MDRRVAVGAGVVAVASVAVGGLAWAVRGLPAKVERLAHRQVEASVNADVAWGAVELAGLSSFPRVGVTIRDLTVTGRGPFAGVELARLGRVSVGIDLFSAFAGDTLRVREVAVDGGTIALRVDREGRANWDVSKGASEEADAFELSLDDVSVRDLDLRYDDRQGRMSVALLDVDVDGVAAWSGPVASTDARASIGSLDLRMGRTRYLKASRWTVDADAAYDTATGGLTLAASTATINAFPLSLSGALAPAGEGWDVDLAFRATDGGFASLLSLVPDAYAGSMEGVEARGTVSFEGTAKGRYEGDTWPAFDVSLGVADAAYRYPSLPEVRAIAVDARVTHAQGPKETVGVSLGRLSFDAGGSPFTVRGTVDRLLGSPVIDLAANGRIDLAALSGSLPVPAGTEVAGGVIDVDLVLKGDQRDFEAPNPDRLVAKGTLAGRGVRVASDSFPAPVTIREFSTSFSPQSVAIGSFAASWADSDLSLTGRFDNLVGYALGADVLRGELAASSRALDLRPFQGRDPEAGTTDEGGYVVPVPTDLDLRLTSDLKKVVTRNLTATDVSGALSVSGGAVRLEDLGASMLGGRATVSGSYTAPTAEAADLDVSVDGLSLDVGDTVAAFVTLRRIAPVLEQVQGAFDSGFSLRTRVGRDGTPDLPITRSAGRLAPTGTARAASLRGAESKLRPLGGEAFSAVDLAGSALQYVLSEGTLRLPPAQVKLGTASATLEGSADVSKRTVDLRFTVPVPLASAAALLGADAPKGEASLVVRVRGPYDDPKVTVAPKGGADDVADLVAGAAADAARARADQILAEARAAADVLLAEADARAKKQLRQAQDPASKLAAEAAAAAIRETARAAADRLLAEARRKADAALAGAEGGGGKGSGTSGAPKKGKKR